MAPMTLGRNEQDWLRTHTADWVGAGLISELQADSIRHFEHDELPVAERRLTLVAEIAIYLGGVIAFAGGAAIIGPNWAKIGLVGQLAIGVALTLLGLVAGTRLVRVGEPGTERLGWFLWAVGTGGVALTAGALVNEFDPADEAWYPLVIGAGVLAASSVLWRNRQRPLQLATTAIGLGMLGGGVAGLTDVSAWIVAPVVWLVAFGFGAAAWYGRVHPRLVALLIAGVGMMVGAFNFSAESERLGAIAALITAAGIVVIAMLDRALVLVVFSVGAFFVATTSMMQTVLHGMVGRLIAVVVGLAVVTFVAVRSQQTSGRPAPPR